MYATPIFQLQNAQQPRRKESRAPSLEQEKKPKKVNSDIRKQQNRIASRNYREKRKRKLQYLQQLIHDGGSADERPTEPTTHFQGQRILSPEYYPPTPMTSTMPPPSNGHYDAIVSSSDNAVDPILATPIASYQNQFPASAPAYRPYEPIWAPQSYDVAPPINVSTWTVPSWIPNIEFSPPLTTRSADDFQFTPPPQEHTFDQLPTPPRKAHTPDPDQFTLGNYRRRYEQSMGGDPCRMSLPSSPFFPPRYPS
ncbi:hypothetical protein P280DRAFT_267921 [Massarina eburnea CBS 473.64]|uniref:BZIP domain-containing protein n=1 Tax=Massarina eburnea CBS 473.64 TaxID=1395130 RepID=A0A6A6S5M2_9PLEO|nr:hypothetical protein P280DRAFT_267921 [Massarina eburnea CBS 473.64]